MQLLNLWKFTASFADIMMVSSMHISLYTYYFNEYYYQISLHLIPGILYSRGSRFSQIKNRHIGAVCSYCIKRFLIFWAVFPDFRVKVPKCTQTTHLRLGFLFWLEMDLVGYKINKIRIFKLIQKMWFTFVKNLHLNLWQKIKIY